MSHLGSNDFEAFKIDNNMTKILICLLKVHSPFANLNSRIKSAEYPSLSFFCKEGGRIHLTQKQAHIAIDVDMVQNLYLMLSSADKLMVQHDNQNSDSDTVM